jgi:hypothetical protein
MFSVEYYHPNVLADIESWPVDRPQADQGVAEWLN